LVAAAIFLVAATKILFVVLNFVAGTKPFFPCSTAQLCRSETENFILGDLFSSELSQLKKYRLPGYLKFNYLDTSQSGNRVF